MSDGSAVITRFAPSPTGKLHLGGARTALFAWALARRRGGRFLVRIEDTDQARSDRDAVTPILADLAWLGLDWDEGPEHEGHGGDPRNQGSFFQSERLAHYEAALERLLAAELVYPAFETPDALDAMRREAQAAKQNFRYRRAPGTDAAEALRRMAAGEPHVLRFRMPSEAIRVDDEVLGAVRFEPEEFDDFIVRKRDGFPTYHLAVVVDDEAMGVTHVLRGQEHLNNTPRHVALQEALGFRRPIYAHLPTIQNPDGSKLSKRDKDKAARAIVRDEKKRSEAALRERIDDALAWDALERWLGDKRAQLEGEQLDALANALALELPGQDVSDFRAGGYLPEVVGNFLALLGWSTGEKTDDGKDRDRFDLAYLAAHFDPARVGKANARFDRDKLLAFNQDALGALAPEAFADAARGWATEHAPERLAALDDAFGLFAAAVQPRVRTLADAFRDDGPGAFVFAADDGFEFDPKAVDKWLRKGDPSGFERLAEVREVLAALDGFSPDAIEAAVQTFCSEREIGMGKAAQPLRVAVTGSAASPPLGQTLALVGRDGALARIDRCLASRDA